MSTSADEPTDRQVAAADGFAEDEGGHRILRDGVPQGAGAVVRLVIITVVCLLIATWRVRRLRPGGADE